jgi:hypothetical protein
MKIFENEIKNNNRIEKIISIARVHTFWDTDTFNIELELIDGKRITFQIENSIYNVIGIIGIDNYRIWALELVNSGINSYATWDGIYYWKGLVNWALEFILEKPEGYFGVIDNLIDNFDEIKEFMENIYNEERIPGDKEDKGRGNIDKWGDDQHLQNYSGYVFTNKTDRIKIYVENILDNIE